MFSVESADICRGDIIKVEGGDLVSGFFPYFNKIWPGVEIIGTINLSVGLHYLS